MMGADRWYEESQARLHESCTARIKALEQQCATLAAEIDRMTSVVETAQRWHHGGERRLSGAQRIMEHGLSEAVTTYEAS